MKSKPKSKPKMPPGKARKRCIEGTVDLIRQKGTETL